MTGIPEREGLQPERTALSWQRTALVSTLAAVAVMALGVQVADWVSAAIGGVATIAGVALTEVIRHRVLALRHDEVAAAQWPPLVGVCLVVSLTGVAAALVALRIATV